MFVRPQLTSAYFFSLECNFNLTTTDKELNVILEAQSTVFQEGLGKVEGIKAKIYIDPSEKPPFFKGGREGVKWELGFAFFGGWEMGFCALGLGFMKEKTIEKWEWDFNLSNTGWDCGI